MGVNAAVVTRHLPAAYLTATAVSSHEARVVCDPPTGQQRDHSLMPMPRCLPLLLRDEDLTMGGANAAADGACCYMPRGHGTPVSSREGRVGCPPPATRRYDHPWKLSASTKTFRVAHTRLRCQDE